MTTDWYFRIDGVERGPISSVRLKQLAIEGRISRGTYVRKGAAGTWIQASSVKGLFEPSGVAPPLPPTSQSPRAPLREFDPPGNKLAEGPASIRPSARGNDWFSQTGDLASTPIVRISPPTKLAVASLLVGLLSLLAFWVPPVGMSLAGMGILLGATGIVLARVRQRSGIGYGIAGLTINATAIVVSIAFALTATQYPQDSKNQTDFAGRDREVLGKKEATTVAERGFGNDGATLPAPQQPTLSKESRPSQESRATGEPKASAKKQNTLGTIADALAHAVTQPKESQKTLAANTSARTWTDSTGKHRVEGELDDFDGWTVILKRPDGKTLSVALSTLSKDDQAFVMDNPRTDIGIFAAEYKDGGLVGRSFGPAGFSGKAYRGESLFNGYCPTRKAGLFVHLVVRNTPAFRAGLRMGDLIATVDGKPARPGCFAYRTKTGKCEIVIEQMSPPLSRLMRPGSHEDPAKCRWREMTLSIPALPVAQIVAAGTSHEVSMVHYNMIEKGMTEEEVEKVFGFAGRVDTTAGVNDKVIKGVTWEQRIPGAISPRTISVDFLNGEVHSKQFLGLDVDAGP